jgi:hypothetical protein
MQRPVGIPQHLSREQHQIGLLVANDLVGGAVIKPTAAVAILASRRIRSAKGV